MSFLQERLYFSRLYTLAGCEEEGTFAKAVNGSHIQSVKQGVPMTKTAVKGRVPNLNILNYYLMKTLSQYILSLSRYNILSYYP